MVLFQIPSNYDPGPKMAPPQGLSVVHRKSLKNLPSQKLLGQFQSNFTGMFLGWSSFRFLQIMNPPTQTGPGPGLISFSQENLKKSYSQKQLGQFKQEFTGMFLWWSSFRFLQITTPGLKLAPPQGLSVFGRKIFKILLRGN